MEPKPRRLSLRKRLLFNGLLLIGTWLLIEACSFAATQLFMGATDQLLEQQQAAAEDDPFLPGGQFFAPAVIHPYVGAVMEPAGGDKPASNETYQVTPYGFIDDAPPLHKRSPDKVIVAILGGSVARQLGMNATQVLQDELSQSPEFAGKKFEFVRLGSNGYKQPQQLMTINYLSVLGAEFDIIINLDGFNEAVLPAQDNVPFGVNSIYPRDWGKLVAGTSRPEFVRMGGYVSYLRQQQREDARWFGRVPWRYSPTALFIWSVRKDRRDAVISDQLSMMSRYVEKSPTYGGSGPPEKFDSTEAVYEHSVDLWFRSSTLLQQLCTARGIRYYHFLQPNQYVPGSKQIGAEEAKDAINEKTLMCIGVRTAYPLMQARGPKLIEAGIVFTDLTRVFADHPEPIYSDVCCHVHPTGDEIMAKAIAAAIKQDIQRRAE